MSYESFGLSLPRSASAFRSTTTATVATRTRTRADLPSGRRPSISFSTKRSRTRSYIQMSRLRDLRDEVVFAAPDTPDDGERLLHAVPEGVHLRLALGALAGVV